MNSEVAGAAVFDTAVATVSTTALLSTATPGTLVIAGMLCCDGPTARLRLSRSTKMQTKLAIYDIVALTLTHRQHQVRGHATRTSHSTVEQHPKTKTNQAKKNVTLRSIRNTAKTNRTFSQEIKVESEAIFILLVSAQATLTFSSLDSRSPESSTFFCKSAASFSKAEALSFSASLRRCNVCQQYKQQQ